MTELCSVCGFKTDNMKAVGLHCLEEHPEYFSKEQIEFLKQMVKKF